jgi:arylsulfatase A-like enzyme
MNETSRGPVIRPTAVAVAGLGIALGLASGLVHSGVVAWTRHFTETFTWSSRDLLWMAPAADVFFLSAVAAPLALLAWRRRVSWRIATTILGFFAVLSVLLHFSRLHWAPLLLLSAGLAVQLGSLAARFPEHTARLGRRSAIALSVVTIGLGVGERLMRGERGEVITAPPDGAPNVLVLILDTVRARSMSLHGYARTTTPHIDSLAADAIVFERAIAPSSWTLPSHASMFTGLPAGALSTSWRTPFDGSVPTVASVFQRNGYATGAFVANFFYTHHESGLAAGFEEFRDFKVSFQQLIWSSTFGQTPLFNKLIWARTPGAIWNAVRTFDLRIPAEPHSHRKWTGEVVGEFLAWQRRERGRPFFAFLNLYDAHDPYAPPGSWYTRYSPSPTKLDLYDSGLAYMDSQLAPLFRALREQGALDRTIVVVTSDHGEQFGEHGLMNHGNSLYMPVTHVPLVIRYPAALPGPRRVATPVTLRDLAATLLDLAGVPNDGTIPGATLRDACCGAPYASPVVAETEQLEGKQKDHVPAGWGPLASIVADSLHFIRNGNGTFELYHVGADSGEMRNLAASPEWCNVAAALDKRLRGITTNPATPTFDAARCRGAHRRGSGVGSAR